MSTTIKARIESCDVQPNSIIRMSALFRLFQKAAGDDLDKTGMTYDVLRKHGIVFVLTKKNIQFYDDIKTYDEVVVTTYPRETRGVAFIRDYDVFVAGKLVAYASSSWALLDINNRKLLRPTALNGIGTIPTDSNNIIEIEDERIRLNAENLEKTDVREVYYSQIDTNGHMNNTFYPDVMFDYMPDIYKTTLKNKKLSVYYTNEIMCGQKFDVFTKCTPEKFMILAKNSETEKDVFSATMNF